MMFEKILFFAILLGVLVLIHELGHFLVAKACRVQVLKFSFGFGPELFGFRIGETRYAISAVPLGGFVRMAGEDDLVERWGGPDAPEIDQERLLNSKPLWQRAAILAAGPIANILLPIGLFSLEAIGDNPVTPPVVETVFPDTPAARAGLQAGDRIVAIDAHPVATFEDISEWVKPRAGATVEVSVRRGEALVELQVPLRRAADQDELQRVVERGRMGIASFKRRPLISLHGGAAADSGLRNLDLVLQVDGADVSSFDELERRLRAAVDRPVELLVERRQTLVDGAVRLELPRFERLRLAPSAASQPGPTSRAASTQPGLADQEATAEGPGAELTDAVEYHVKVEPDDVEAALVQSTQAAARSVLAERDGPLRGLGFGGVCFAGVVEDTPASQLGLGRGDCMFALDGRAVHFWGTISEIFTAKPGAAHVAVVQRGGALHTLAFRLDKREEKTPLRRGHDRHVFGAAQPIAFAPGGIEMVHRGPLEAAVAGLTKTYSLTVMTIVGIGMLATGQLPFQSVGGPMMLFDLAGKTSERGLGYFLSIMAFISINLAILNLLPIPVLDGGHLVFILIEAVIRRPLPNRVKEIAILFGFSLLVLLMIAVFRNDISRYWTDIAGLFR